MTPAEIAGAAGLAEITVRRGIRRARQLDAGQAAAGAAADRDGRLDDAWVLPLMPAGPLTPSSPCPHRGPLPGGSRTYCVVCDDSGLDRPA